MITLSSTNRRVSLRVATIRSETRSDYSYEGVSVSRLGFTWSSRLQMMPWALSYYANMGPAVRRIAGLIERLLADTSESRAMGLSGYEKMRRSYTWPKIAQKILGFYRSLDF